MAWYYDGKWKALENTQTFDDPLQGIQNNCTFIAALCSAVWKNYARPDLNPLNPTPVFKLPFYDNGLKEVYVTGKLSCDTSNNPDWAKSKDFLPGSNLYEIWPSLYEKAYGVFCLYLDNILHPDPLNPYANLPTLQNPCDVINMSIPWISDIKALEHLTNRTRSLQFFASDYADAVAHIKTFCAFNGVIMYPMLAWTKSLNYQPTPKNTCWNSNPKLRDNHVYSVLGVYPKKSTAADIVLRDPKGMDVNGIPIVGTKSGSWNGVTLDTNGIFTIDSTKFKDCFNYYQYVV